MTGLVKSESLRTVLKVLGTTACCGALGFALENLLLAPYRSTAEVRDAVRLSLRALHSVSVVGGTCLILFKMGGWKLDRTDVAPSPWVTTHLAIQLGFLWYDAHVGIIIPVEAGQQITVKDVVSVAQDMLFVAASVFGLFACNIATSHRPLNDIFLLTFYLSVIPAPWIHISQLFKTLGLWQYGRSALWNKMLRVCSSVTHLALTAASLGYMARLLCAQHEKPFLHTLRSAWGTTIPAATLALVSLNLFLHSISDRYYS